MPDIVDSDITSSLEALRTSHGKRRSHFTQSKSSSCPLSRSQLAQLPLGIEYRAHHIQVLRDNGSTEVDPALAKLVPLLCKLSAYRGAMDSNSTSTVRDWMNCVGQLMLQAALEMLLVHGISEADVLREIFSWTWKADSNVDEMYPNQHEREVSEWDKIKAGWAGVVCIALLPRDDSILTFHSSRRHQNLHHLHITSYKSLHHILFKTSNAI
jgi:hypothetical protein